MADTLNNIQSGPPIVIGIAPRSSQNPFPNLLSSHGDGFTDSRLIFNSIPDSLSEQHDEKPLEQLSAAPAIASSGFPEGGLKAWLVVAGSFAVIAATFGLTTSVGLFQAYWQTHQLSQYSSQNVGWIASSQVSLNFFLGVQIGPLFDRYGPRWLLFVGSIGYVASFVILAQCTKYWHFILNFGILGGISGALLTTVALAVIAHWFEARRGLATGITLMGSSLGGIIFPIALQSTLKHLSWAWSMRLVALVILILMIIGNFCVRGRLPTGKRQGSINLNCFRDARFAWTTLGVACMCPLAALDPCKELWQIWLTGFFALGFEFVLFGALGLLPSYALDQGFSSRTSFYVLAVLNAGSAVGRYTSGHLSDHYGRFNSMALTLIISFIATFALWLPVGHDIVLFYIMAPVFGFGSGSIISLAPVCVGQLCKADEFGQWFGTSYSVVSFATLICIPIGGQILSAAGTTVFICFFGGILVVALASFTMARWACLEYRWVWKAKI